MAQRIRHTKVSLPNYNKSFALLSDAAEDEVNRAVIFIHGFNGSARGTWTDFLSLVDDPSAASGWWERADLFFFDYQWDSIFRQLTNNTLTIYKFVNDVFPKPEAIGRAHSFRSDAFEYDNLTLVGHSEGGLLLRRVIVRAAQLDTAIDAFMEKSLYEKATRPDPEGMLKADMRLFAPALGGDMQSGIVGILSSLPVVSHALSASAARKGMDQGSPSVIEARKRSDNYAKYLRFPCFEAHITWAEKDSIINSEKYDRDHECVNFPPGSSHTSVCKPTLTYPEPIGFVEEGVNQYGCK
jgi:pimeloyl-ACP methyl ester carboxylesterase